MHVQTQAQLGVIGVGVRGDESASTDARFAMQTDVVRALRHLDSLILHSKDLVQSQVGRAVKNLRAHQSEDIKTLACKVCLCSYNCFWCTRCQVNSHAID